MENNAGYTVGQLSKLASVSTRTIRYYTAEGLLPSPETRGRYALYNDDHLLRLQLIKRLKAQYMPLGAIRDWLVRLSPSDVRQSLLDEGLLVAPANSVAESIAQVIGQSLPAPPKLMTELPSGYQVAPVAPGAQESDALAPEAAPLAPLPDDLVSPPPANSTAPWYGRAELQAGLPSVAGLSQGEVWQRLVLAPGVELHLRAPLGDIDRGRIGQLLGFASELFGRRG